MEVEHPAYDPKIIKNLRLSAAKAAAALGASWIDADDVYQEVMVLLCEQYLTLTPDEYKLATSSVALFRRCVDVVRRLSPVSRYVREKAQEYRDCLSETATIKNATTRRAVESYLQNHVTQPATSTDLLSNMSESRSNDEDRILLREALRSAITSLVESGLDEIDTVVLQDWLIDQSVTIKEIGVRFSLSESAVSMRSKKLRSLLQASLQEQGYGAVV